MFRNKEICQFTLLWGIMATVFTCAGFTICMEAGILVLILAVSYGTAFFLFTRARYLKIARLSEQIDRVLHYGERFWIDGEREGELSILQSEITKMTVRIREQNSALKEEKIHLADSLADIAHQLRTPLTSVSLIISLLENTPDRNERKSLLREMEELLVRMDWLITSLLKLSRLDAGVVVFQRERIDVDSLIRAALQPLLISIDLHNIAVQVQADGIKIWGDMNWLAEAIRNIVKNCMESTGDNGMIKIACTDTPLFTEIVIHDDGPGIEEKDLLYLFDRFYQGKDSGRAGYGIGLALCKTIITGQGGNITAKNDPQGGAVFCIRFPK